MKRFMGMTGVAPRNRVRITDRTPHTTYDGGWKVVPPLEDTKFLSLSVGIETANTATVATEQAAEKAKLEEALAQKTKRVFKPSRETMMQLGVTVGFVKTFIAQQSKMQMLLQPCPSFATKYDESCSSLVLGETAQGMGSRVRVRTGRHRGCAGTVIRCIQYPVEQAVSQWLLICN
jgi:hypothetical protein